MSELSYRDEAARSYDRAVAHVSMHFVPFLLRAARLQPGYSDFGVARTKLAKHRADGLTNLDSIGQITWSQLAEVLDEAEGAASREDERAYASRAATWLRERVLS
jgi:hypothetical protein